MVARNKHYSSVSHAAPSADNQRTIDTQTADFIARGGVVQEIPMGVTAYAKLYGPSAEARTAAGGNKANT